MTQPDLIKLHVPGESFWATKLTENTAKVDNILMKSEVSLNDIVKFNPKDNKVISILIKKSNTVGITYEISGDIQETYKSVYNHFEDNGIPVEGMLKGVVLLAVPVGLPDSAVEKLIKKCPAKVELMVE